MPCSGGAPPWNRRRVFRCSTRRLRASDRCSAKYIRTEAVPASGLTATLFHLADRDLFALRQDSAKKWTVQSVGDAGAWTGVDPVSLAVGSALDLSSPGRTFRADGSVTAGRTLTSAKEALAAAAKSWALEDGFVVKRRAELWLRLANVAGPGARVGLLRPVDRPDDHVGAAVRGVLSPVAPVLAAGSRHSAHSPPAADLWSQAGGFHRMLATESAESRFDFAARKDLYTAYIPFAVAGGAAALWAAKYQTATGQLPPQPDWYHSSSVRRVGCVFGPGC